MEIKEKIKIDLKEFLKERKKEEASVLRMLLAAILTKEKEKRAKIVKSEEKLSEEELSEKSQLEDDEIIPVILSEVKKRKEAILSYEKGEREDLADKEKEELLILKKYLPEQMTDEEIEKIVKEAVEKLGASSIKDMGGVMKEIMPKVQGKAEGSKISQIVKKLLSE